MPAFLVLLFVIVPLAELVVILQVGGVIGGWWTAALLLAFSVAGAWLLKVEGRRAWAEFRSALEEGRWPGDAVAQGALIIVGGTLLVTPGFLTDGVGLLLLLGPTRRLVSAGLRERLGRSMAAGGPDGGPARSTRPGGEDVVLDVEVVEVRREQSPQVGDGPGEAGSGPQG